jgi:hypothetical protein
MSIEDSAAERAQHAADDGEAAEAAVLRILRGNPNPAEVAALIVALAHIRARNAAMDATEHDAAVYLPTTASWDQPYPVSYRSPFSWMHAA